MTIKEARIAFKEDNNGTLATYTRAVCPKPLTITKDKEETKKVKESLSLKFDKPTPKPRITKIA